MNRMKVLWQDERGIGTVEMILILVVLIALVLIFKEQLTDLVKCIIGFVLVKRGSWLHNLAVDTGNYQ